MATTLGLEVGLRLLGGVVLLFSNAFFVMTEFAMTRVPQFEEAAFQGSRGLERAWKMQEKLELYLSGCQIGITISSVGLGIVAEPAVAAVLRATLPTEVANLFGGGTHLAAVILALVVINLLHVIVGEQTPTYLGVERTRTVAKYGAPVLHAWATITKPAILFADWAAKAILGLFGVSISRSWTEAETDEEEEKDEVRGRGGVRRRMGSLLSEGNFTRERREEVLNAVEIGDRSVSEILVPRDEMTVVSTEDEVEAALDTLRTSHYVRVPLVGDSLDEFEGILYLPKVFERLDDLRAGEVSLAAVAAPPMTVSAGTSISDLIDRFQAENQELALVLDGGEVVGLVTAVDAFEAITGDLEDPLEQGG